MSDPPPSVSAPAAPAVDPRLCTHLCTHLYTRRAWLRHSAALTTATAAVVAVPRRFPGVLPSTRLQRLQRVPAPGALAASAALWGDGADPAALAQQAVDAARQAGADYAEARLTRTLSHGLGYLDLRPLLVEQTGIGVRALVKGYWGFAACPSAEGADIVALARQAVAQAVVNAKGAVPRTVNLGSLPPATGTWATPVKIDPFTIPLEEKYAYMDFWDACARKQGLTIDHFFSRMHFVRQARVLATSEGTHVQQTVYESGGVIQVQGQDQDVKLPLQGLTTAGRGWELFLEADIPAQLEQMAPKLEAAAAASRQGVKPASVGRYTLVCDGTTMATMLNATLGVATQLDRALGYEANAGGTSFLDDPLGMLGTYQVASPLVTVTANRSSPGQLATMQWDDEGVVPQEATLIKHGVLHDFQTTREQAAWLAPYYEKTGQPVRSHGCAAAPAALDLPLQHMPNLALEPGPAALGLADLIANVTDGLLVEGGIVRETDFQASTGLLMIIPDFGGQLREIRNGRLGRVVTTGAIQFSTLDFWKQITALGGPATRRVVPVSQFAFGDIVTALAWQPKGEPQQVASRSIQAVAATVLNQPLINPLRKV